MFSNIYFHPKNKMSLYDLKHKLTLPELLDYQEALEATQLLSEAAEKDERAKVSK